MKEFAKMTPAEKRAEAGRGSKKRGISVLELIGAKAPQAQEKSK